MEAFYYHSFKDKDLPVEDLPNLCHPKAGWYGAADRVSCQPRCGHHKKPICGDKHRRRSNCFHHQAWNASAFHSFYENQWSLLLQSFKKSSPELGIPVLTIGKHYKLPFLEDDKARKKGEGHFGIVEPARMLQSYQNTIDLLVSALLHNRIFLLTLFSMVRRLSMLRSRRLRTCMPKVSTSVKNGIMKLRLTMSLGGSTNNILFAQSLHISIAGSTICCLNGLMAATFVSTGKQLSIPDYPEI
jgi:hypothetical protein